MRETHVSNGLEGWFAHFLRQRLEGCIGEDAHTDSRPWHCGRNKLFTIIWRMYSIVRGFAKKKKFQKFEISMEVGGWVQVALRIFFGKIIPK